MNSICNHWIQYLKASKPWIRDIQIINKLVQFKAPWFINIMRILLTVRVFWIFGTFFTFSFFRIVIKNAVTTHPSFTIKGFVRASHTGSVLTLLWAFFALALTNSFIVCLICRAYYTFIIFFETFRIAFALSLFCMINLIRITCSTLVLYPKQPRSTSALFVKKIDRGSSSEILYFCENWFFIKATKCECIFAEPVRQHC